MPKDADLVIHSPAVKPDNPEIKQAKKLKIKIQTYPQALGDLTKEYFTIAISGTHGKSTTCAMIALILMKAGLDPTVIIGTKLKEFNGNNFRIGKSKYLVIEADEWQASFLNYWPKIIVLTNIEREHLDYYRDLKHILSTYKEYVGHLSKHDILITNQDDKNISKLLDAFRQTPRRVAAQTSKLQFKTQNYSLKQKESEKLRKILKVPGEHNIYNALAALTLARTLRIPDRISSKAFSEYKCVWRRFEIVKKKGFTIISDYAHHPTEVRATLRAAREKFPNKEIWCIFQPHQYQRTFYLFNDFVRVFSNALRQTQGKPLIDKLIITDIYDVAGREKKKIKEKISSKELIRKIKKAKKVYLPKEKIKDYLKRNLKGGEVVIIMGAGDIYQLAEEFSTR